MRIYSIIIHIEINQPTNQLINVLRLGEGIHSVASTNIGKVGLDHSLRAAPLLFLNKVI